MPISEDLQEMGIVMGSLALFTIFYLVNNNVFSAAPLIADADYIFDSRVSQDLAYNYSTKIDTFNTAHGLIQIGTTLRSNIAFADISKAPLATDLDASRTVLSQWISRLFSHSSSWLYVPFILILVGTLLCIGLALYFCCRQQNSEISTLRGRRAMYDFHAHQLQQSLNAKT